MSAHADTRSRPDLWSRVFAVVYDPFLALGELAGVRRHRRQVLGAARGRVVELGAGTGLNLRHYPPRLDILVLVEPDPAMRKRLARRARSRRASTRIVDASAERLPIADHTVDTVVATFVLCTVDDPQRALNEIHRILRPDGQLLFIEHVRARSSRLAHWQDRLLKPWQRFACGCRCNRATPELMRACDFDVDVSEAAWRAMPPVVRPLAIGCARPTASDGVRVPAL